LLADNARYLADFFDGVADVPRNGLCRFVELTYQMPRAESLLLDSPTKIVLSTKLQRYLTLTAASDYEANRRVVIIAEPHEDVDQQWNLLGGLEILFAENTHLGSDGQIGVLVEGLAANDRLSIQPLVDCEPQPSQQLIRDVLGTYLIPSYLAYMWKHDLDWEVHGTEDPDLYEISNRLHAELWGKAPDRHHGDADQYARLWHLAYRSASP